MDKAKEGKEAKPNRWSWLPVMMPGVQKLLTEKKKTMGASHVALCWQRGVVERQPGWLYLREGAIAVGTPWGEPIPDYTQSQALVLIREKEGGEGNGAH